MSEFEAKLAQVSITNLEINILNQKEETLEIQSSYSATIHDPKEDGDSTVMVKVETEVFDLNKEKIGIECYSEFVYELNSIPNNFAELLIKNAQEEIQTVIMNKIIDILQIMGHNLQLQ